MSNKGRSPNLRTHWVDLDWLFETVNVDSSILINKYVRTSDQVAYILTKGMFTMMQWHFLTLWQIRRPYESIDVHSFVRTLFPCSVSAKPQAMSQVMTQPESVDQMWDKYATKVLKSGCILSDRVFGSIAQSWFWGQSGEEGLSRGNASPDESGG